MEIVNSTVMIPIGKLEFNRGQIPDVKKCPKVVKDNKYIQLRDSIRTFPEMLELRELLVFPFQGKFVVIDGDKRLKICREDNYKSVPAKIIDENTPASKLNELIIKCDLKYSELDDEILIADWDVDELAAMGVNIFIPEDIDLSKFFDEIEGGDEKKKKMITCPLCGGEFEK